MYILLKNWCLKWLFKNINLKIYFVYILWNIKCWNKSKNNFKVDKSNYFV